MTAVAPAATAPRLDRLAFQQQFEAMVTNIGHVIKGKDDVVRAVLVAILSEGHVLLEDKPGTGKTMLARAIASTISCRGNRVQCTPDLLPSDVTGTPVLELQTQRFTFRQGPVFCNVLLADEINRATPKTQSALLEVMQERQVTADGVTYPLPAPFIILATQNPIELAGTFPLPEAQLDRFLFKLSIGYATLEAERQVLLSQAGHDPINDLKPVTDTEHIIAMTQWARGVSVPEPVMTYILQLCAATRNDPALLIGASTRASLGLMRAARVLAASQGREDVYPDDVRSLLKPVLAHRLILTPDALLREETVEKVVERIANRVKAPLGVES